MTLYKRECEEPGCDTYSYPSPKGRRKPWRCSEHRDLASAPIPANRTDTSDAAADSQQPTIARKRAKVLAMFALHDWTCDELEIKLNWPHQTVSARINDLWFKYGAIRDSGRRRPTRTGRLAIVWVLR